MATIFVSATNAVRSRWVGGHLWVYLHFDARKVLPGLLADAGP